VRGLLLFRLAELWAARAARSAVEARYFAGHTALFPDAVKAWDEQVRNTETLADVASRLAELDSIPPAGPDPEAVAARVTALEKLGEGGRALRIGTAWLRAKLKPVAAVAAFAT
jgi:hypothetical protein